LAAGAGIFAGQAGRKSACAAGLYTVPMS